MVKKPRTIKKVKKIKVKAPPHIEINFGCVQDYGVYVVISKDVPLVVKWLRSWLSDKIEEDDFKGCNGLCFRFGEMWPVVCLPHFPKTPRELGTLAHEAFHAVYFVCYKIGIEVDTSSEEIISRMVSYVVTNVLENKNKFVGKK